VTNQALNIGLLADNANGLAELTLLLCDTPFEIACSVLIDTQNLPLRDDIDVWVLNISEHCAHAETFLDWLNDQKVAHLILETGALTLSARSLSDKINDVFYSGFQGKKARNKPNRVWVLAASTGGPQAIADFLSELGDKASSDAFVYVQHIEAHSFQALLTTVKRNTSLAVEECKAGLFIEAGHIYVVDPIQAFGLSESGRIVGSSEKWSGVYTPSIDQVIAKVARIYRAQSAAIVFTGMGNDGAASCRLMQALGGTIVTQSFESCTVDSMPRSVVDQIDVAFSGTAEALASKVAEYSEAQD